LNDERPATKPGRTPVGVEEAHRHLRISPADLEEVAAELERTLDFVKGPKREKAEVLAAFAAHKTRSLPAMSALNAAETVFVAGPDLSRESRR
jgi:hypothetical protein